MVNNKTSDNYNDLVTLIMKKIILIYVPKMKPYAQKTLS